MVRAGPSLEPEELRIFGDFVQRLITGGKAECTASTLERAPSARWASVAPEQAIERLPSRVSYVLGKYAMSFARDFSHEHLKGTAALAARADAKLSPHETRYVLMATALWMDPKLRAEFSQSASLSALEELNSFTNGYMQSISVRALDYAPPDELNRTFAAFQRRRHGITSKARSPKGLIRHLPQAAKDIIANYSSLLQGGGTSSGITSPDAYVMLLATALGRGYDTTLIAQLKVTLAAAIIWRSLPSFPSPGKGVHPALGPAKAENPLWKVAAKAAGVGLKELSHERTDGTPSDLVLPVANGPIHGVTLDATSVVALQRYIDYLTCFARWGTHKGATQLNLQAFDSRYRRTTNPITSGISLLGTLPEELSNLLADIRQLKGSSTALHAAAEQVASVLGDTEQAPWCYLAIECASAWLSGSVSPLESGERGAFLQRLAAAEAAITESAPPPSAHVPTGATGRVMMHKPQPRRIQRPHAEPRSAAQPVIDLRNSTRQNEILPQTTHMVDRVDLTAEALMSDEELTPFALASPKVAQEFVDFGLAIADLVRMSQQMGNNGETASGWWSRFHRDALGDRVPNPASFLHKLSPKARRMVSIYTGILRAEDSRNVTRAGQALAIPLQQLHDDHTLRALATGLAVASVWSNMDELSGDLFSDALLGAAPFTEPARHLCHRAQVQVEWGLKGLLQNENVTNV